MPSLSADQLVDMQATFDTHAKGGTVSNRDLGKVFRAVGLNPTEGQLADWKKQCGSGDIDFSKFKSIALKKFDESNDSTDEILDSFSAFDKDGSGFISAVEFKHILCNMGESLSEKEISQVMQEIDVGGDGMINYRVLAEQIYSSEN